MSVYVYKMKCKPLSQSRRGKGCKGRVRAKQCRTWGSQPKCPFSEMAVFPALRPFVKNKIFYYIIFQFQLPPLLGSRVVYFQKFRNILLLTICLNSCTYWASAPGPNICGPRAPSSHQGCSSGDFHAPNICNISLSTALWAHQNKLPFLLS